MGIRFLTFGFDIDNFDAYRSYFDENSIMVLAQTGEYKGVEEIEEYVKFTDGKFNPFLVTQTTIDEENTYLGYDRETDQCEFLAKYHVCGQLEPTTTGSDLEYCNTAFIKLYFSFFERKISRVNVFYHEGYLDLFFGTIAGSDESRETICDTANNACSGITNPITNCTTEIAQLPVFNDGGYVDGLSQGCRVLHAALAEQNPQDHCAHIAINATLDPLGLYKCQDSSHIQPEDLFTDEELASFDEFALSHGIDPAVGYAEV